MHMGVNNRKRRADKRKKAQKQRQSAPPGYQNSDSFDSFDSFDQVTNDLETATDALRFATSCVHGKRTGALIEILDFLEEGLPEIVDLAANIALDGFLSSLWERGWQPVDIARITRQQLKSLHLDLVIDIIAENAATYDLPDIAVDPAWMNQLETIGAERWWSNRHPYLPQWQRHHDLTRRAALETIVEVLALLESLPSIPVLLSPPGKWQQGPRRVIPHNRKPSDEQHSKILERVRGLLAKAESTTFEAEAESLTEKAQQLMARYAIDQAMLHVGSENDESTPDARRIGIDDPYAQCKSSLLHRVALANDCKAIWSRDLGFATIFGFAENIETVELLHTSLLVQATTAMVAAGSKRNHSGQSRTRSFRQSFLYAYATRIGERLEKAKHETVVEAGKEHGPSLLPVLASRDEAVTDYFDRLFPESGSLRMSATDREGWIAGNVAADHANLNVFNEVR